MIDRQPLSWPSSPPADSSDRRWTAAWAHAGAWRCQVRPRRSMAADIASREALSGRTTRILIMLRFLGPHYVTPSSTSGSERGHHAVGRAETRLRRLGRFSPMPNSASPNSQACRTRAIPTQVSQGRRTTTTRPLAAQPPHKTGHRGLIAWVRDIASVLCMRFPVGLRETLLESDFRHRTAGRAETRLSTSPDHLTDSEQCFSRLPDVPDTGRAEPGLARTAEHHCAPTVLELTNSRVVRRGGCRSEPSHGPSARPIAGFSLPYPYDDSPSHSTRIHPALRRESVWMGLSWMSDRLMLVYALCKDGTD